MHDLLNNAPALSHSHFRLVQLLFFLELFNLIAILDLVNKDFSRFETRYKMFFNDQGGIAGNIARNLFLSLLVYKASKSTDVNVISIRHERFTTLTKASLMRLLALSPPVFSAISLMLSAFSECEFLRRNLGRAN